MIQKTIIANWGHAGQGKSETIRLVYDNLMNNHSGAISTLINPIGLIGGDIQVIITINGFTIGIESQGDPNSRLFQSIPLFVSHNCDLIICATRTSGGTVNLVNDTANNQNYRLIWSTNHRSTSNNITQNQLNQYSANQLTDLVINVLNGNI